MVVEGDVLDAKTLRAARTVKTSSTPISQARWPNPLQRDGGSGVLTRVAESRVVTLPIVPKFWSSVPSRL